LISYADQEKIPDEVLKHVKSMLTELKSIRKLSKETTSNDSSSEILYVKEPTYFNFHIFQLVSLVYWWANGVLTSSDADKSLDKSPEECQPSLPAKKSNDESEGERKIFRS